jgi:hypothetical protein
MGFDDFQHVARGIDSSLLDLFDVDDQYDIACRSGTKP